MSKVSHTLESVEKQMEGITKESEQFIQKTNLIADDIQHKTNALNGLFTSFQEVGTSLQTVSRSVQEVSEMVDRYSKTRSEEVAQAVQWGQAAIDLYGKWKQRRQKSAH